VKYRKLHRKQLYLNSEYDDVSLTSLFHACTGRTVYSTTLPPPTPIPRIHTQHSVFFLCKYVFVISVKTGPWHPNSSLLCFWNDFTLWGGFPLSSSFFTFVGECDAISDTVHNTDKWPYMCCHIGSEMYTLVISPYLYLWYSVPLLTSRIAEAEAKLAWNTLTELIGVCQCDLVTSRNHAHIGDRTSMLERSTPESCRINPRACLLKWAIQR